MEKLRKFTDTIRTKKKVVSSSADVQGGNGGQSGSLVGTERGSDELSMVDGADSDSGYHGQVLEEDDKNIDPEQEKRDLQNWFVGKLKCKRHIDDNYRNADNSSSSSSSGGGASGQQNKKVKSSDGRYADDYAVLDPRKMK